MLNQASRASAGKKKDGDGDVGAEAGDDSSGKLNLKEHLLHMEKTDNPKFVVLLLAMITASFSESHVSRPTMAYEQWLNTYM